MLFIWLITTLQQEPPAGELALLRWVIGAMAAAITFLGGIIKWLYDNNQKREDEIRREMVSISKELAESNRRLADEINNLGIVLNITDEMRKIAQAVIEESKRGGRSNAGNL